MGYRVTAGCVDEYLTTTTSLEVSAVICAREERVRVHEVCNP